MSYALFSPPTGLSHPDPRWRGGYGTHNGAQYRRVLSTNAIKDTVSVLYWYEELSRNGNFWTGSSEPFFVRFFRGVYNPWCRKPSPLTKAGNKAKGTRQPVGVSTLMACDSKEAGLT